MRLLATEFMTIDGVVQDPQNWSFDYITDETQLFKLDELRKSDALLLGRKTYEAFAKSWPSRKGDEYSDKFNAMPKYVVSSSLRKADWNNSHILGSDLRAEILKLKKKPGQDVVVHGSVALTRWLIQNDLLDRMHLLIYPLTLGKGLRLFDENTHAKFGLVQSRPYKSGVVLLVYERAKAGSTGKS